MKYDHGTSCRAARNARRHSVDHLVYGGCLHRGLGLLCLALFLFLSALLRAEVFETNYSTGTLSTARNIVIKRGTFPTLGNIYYHTGSSWQEVLVGPSQTDLTLSSAVRVTSQTTYTGNVPPVGREFDVSVPQNFRTVQFAMSATAKTEGPYVNCLCEISSYPVTIRYGPGTGSSGITRTLTPPVYLSFMGIEGAAGISVDNGFPDNDGDGIPDNEDPDDDNDGRPDNDDDFPNNPDEKDDTDGDGQGDNADPDDDNDGTPDVDDAFPFDPGRFLPDADNDGTPDIDDAFPNNPGEDADNDGDGVGDNQDPDDNTPPGGGDQGDGDGNPGTGDGGGGPGPIIDGDPDNDDDEVQTNPGDTSGAVKPDATKHDVVGAAKDLGPAITEKLGEFRPLGNSVIPRASSYTLNVPAGRFGSYNYVFNFDAAPWSYLRTLMLIVVIYVVGRDFMKRITV